MEQTQKISDERLAERLKNATRAGAAHERDGSAMDAKMCREDAALLRELTALRASHKRLAEVLDAIPINEAQSFSRDDVRAALADARTLEGK